MDKKWKKKTAESSKVLILYIANERFYEFLICFFLATVPLFLNTKNVQNFAAKRLA